MGMTKQKILLELIGSVASTVELATSKAGKPWLRLDVEVQDGGKYPRRVRVVCFGDVAVTVAAHVKRGDVVQAFGRPQAEGWLSRTGEAKASLECIADVVTLVDDGGKPAAATDDGLPF